MRIPLATTIESRDGTLTRDAKVKNGIVETRGEDVPPIVRKRPGLTDLGLVRAGAAQLLYYWFGKVRAVIGDYINAISGATAQTLGDWSSVSLPSFDNWALVAHDGTAFAAAVINNSIGSLKAAYSTDGSNWTAAATSEQFIARVLIGAPGIFVLTGYNSSGGGTAKASVSTDHGATWADATLPATKLWNCGCYNSTGQKFLLIDNAAYTATSSDGATWSAGGSMPASRDWKGVCWAPELSMYVAVAATGAVTTNIAYSTDGGATWNSVSHTNGVTFYSVAWNGSIFCAFNATSTYYTSTDGINWAARTSPQSSLSVVAASNGKFVAVSTNGATSAYWSSDGITWTAKALSVSVAAQASVYACVAGDGAGMWIVAPFVGSSSANRASFGTNITDSGTALSPTSAGEQFSAQDNGANSPESLLMIKNSTQAWVVDTSDVVTQITDVDYPGKYTVTLTSLTRSSTTATATTAADTNFRAGDSVVIAGVNEAGWNGTYTILSTTRSGQTVPAPDPVAITITRSGTTATATSTAGPHGYTNGQSVTIAGAEQTQYNGTKTITWISATQFSFTVTVTGSAPTSPATGSPAITGKLIRAAVTNTSTGSYGTFRYSTTEPHGLSNGATFYDYGLSTSALTVANATAYTFEATVSGWATGVNGSVLLIVASGLPSVSSIILVGDQAEVTTSGAHGFVTGNLVTISGATQTQYNTNGPVPITIVSSTKFRYQLYGASESPTTPATGTITAQGAASVSGATFTFTVDGTETTPATGTITANSGRTTVPGIAYLNGYFVVMDEQGVLYNSALDDPENWNALEYTSALNEPGAGKAIAKSGNYIAAFKEWSTEFFYDAKNPVGSPLSPVENGFTLVGCASGESVANVDGALMWVAQSKKHKGRSVYAMRGIEQAKVSTPAVERILNADSLATVRAWGARIDGHPCYILTLVGSGVTLVLDASTGIWHEWSTLTIGSSVSVSSITRDGTTATVTCATAHGISDGDPVTIAGAAQTDYNGTFQAAYVSATVFAIEVKNSPATPATGTILAYPYSSSYFKLTHYASANGVDVTLHATDGHLYEIDPDKYQDDGVPVDFFVRTSRLDGGSIRRKKIARISVVGESADDSAMLRFSDDDSATFVSYRRVKLSDAEPNIRRCGAFERRSLEFRHVGNTAPRPEALELLIGE